ncbi:MAG: hypothetical protein E7Z93_00430 [Cyanobacteria bacterium SIG32]|nr:hypothetical protein [Cyanobacteria bacterium SIG32]
MTNWKKVESAVKPENIDKNSSPNGVYVRRDIQEVATIDEENNEKTKYTYLESFMTKDEYANYCIENNIINTLLDKDDSPEGQQYESSLEKPVQYVNGFFYKPNYIKKYKEIMDDILIALQIKTLLGEDISEILNKKFDVFDATGLPENKQTLSVSEIVNLYLSLYVTKENLYSIYKEMKANNK